jgi:transcriptional regulator with XRE-family HTH domain
VSTWKEYKERNPLHGAALEAFEAVQEQMGVGYLILQARASAELSQSQLADAIGTSQPTIARWESGAQVPSVRSLLKIAAATGSELQLGFTNGKRSVAVIKVRPETVIG